MRHNFKKLEVWSAGIDLSIDTCALTKSFPKEERFGFISQMQRASVSIPSNIAEGTSRKSDKHFITYLENALGSGYEWESQLVIAFRVGYIEKNRFEELEKKIQNLQGKIHRFIEKLEKSLTS
ncbi:four helix bundle protein [Nonlabens antarcticus]|uniref:four helix bundle protein n=1 Tax=Nonlabens antarcticus TaxID=392714 RepID=UPI0018916A67|nr:four helix bundle protein [Nonlabens antarcticus]